ncbi:unnamed protein product, partial [marine sediment metagenome]
NEEFRSKKESTAADVERERGVVVKFSDIRGYGFIENEQGKDLFVHYSNIRAAGYRTLHEGQKVEYTVIEGEKGLVAQDVVII